MNSHTDYNRPLISNLSLLKYFLKPGLYEGFSKWNLRRVCLHVVKTPHCTRLSIFQNRFLMNDIPRALLKSHIASDNLISIEIRSRHQIEVRKLGNNRISFIVKSHSPFNSSKKHELPTTLECVFSSELTKFYLGTTLESLKIVQEKDPSLQRANPRSLLSNIFEPPDFLKIEGKSFIKISDQASLILANKLNKNPLIYADKKRSAQDKLQHQLIRALSKTTDDSKGSDKDFIIRTLESHSPKTYEPFSFGVASHQGSKPYQEDGMIPMQDNSFMFNDTKFECKFFGVIDGHHDNGKCSDFINQRLPLLLPLVIQSISYKYESLNDEVICDALCEVFNTIDQEYQKLTEEEGGACVVCALKINDSIFLANIGDCRALLIQKESVYALTEDASAANVNFLKWHVKTQESMICRENNGETRIWGYNVARDVGLPFLNSKPKITKIILDESNVNDVTTGKLFGKKGDFLLLASDGLFDEANNDEVARELRALINHGYTLNDAAKMLATKAGLNDPKSDNVTVMIVPL